MLSICIPIHQYPVRALVLALQKEIQEHNLPCNVICMDDASDPETHQLNAFLTEDPSIEYVLLPSNVGRSIIRNRLALHSSQPYLLFLDVDVLPVHPDFLRRYLGALTSNAVIYGGTAYSSHPPEDPEKRFHWRYGHAKEEVSPAKRNQQEYRSFKTNNFVVSREFFLANPLDESLVGYGHEDSLFANRCARRGISIHHIDNPILHLGLEKQPILISKLETALDNLYRLHQRGELPETPLEAVFRPSLLRWLSHQLSSLLPIFRNKLATDPQTPMIVLDLYKLLYLQKLQKEGKIKSQ